MTRYNYIEQIRRQIYGGFPTDDAEITINLVNQYLDQGIGIAAQTNYVNSIKLDGISYINGSFYTTYKGLTVQSDEQFLYKIELPHIPFGIGQNEGVSTLQFKDSSSRQLSQSVIWLTENQKAFVNSMRPIPNKIYGYSEGESIFVISTLILTPYTAQVCMVSGGNSADLDSTINVPADYIPVISEFLKKELQFERLQPKDLNPDGQDFVKAV